MGVIAIVKNFERAIRNSNNISDVVANPGGGSNVTCENYSSIGDDSYPLINDSVALMNVQGTGRKVVIGYVDVKNTPKANAGDKRIYSRDANGDLIADVWIKNDGSINLANANGSIILNSDGSINLTNANGSIVLLPDGSINLNGVIISPSGNITAPDMATLPNIVADSVLADGKQLVDHNHLAGTPPGTTGTNL